MISRSVRLAALAAVTALTCLSSGGRLLAQTPGHDPDARLRTVLPEAVAERVLARIAEARAHALPAAPLENRALELAAKGIEPADIEAGIARHAERLGRAREALVRGGRAQPADDETEAAELALLNGADGKAISALARAAPSGRSLTVPLLALSSLVNRGLPSDAAILRVRAALESRAVERAAAAPGRPSAAGRPETIPAGKGRDGRGRQ